MHADELQAAVHGIVLAGVHAWGESVLERVSTRPLLPLAGRPVVWYVLHWLRQNGCCRASICANSDTQAFRGCLGDGRALGVELSYYEDVMPRGPAGCMRDAAAGRSAEVFVVVDGTIVTQVDLQAVLQTHRACKADLTVVVRESAHPGRDALLEPAGIYVASPTVLPSIKPRGYQDIKEMLIPTLYRQGLRVIPYPVSPQSSVRVTGAASYLAANGWVAEWAAGSDAWVGPRVHASARVAKSACLAGPVMVGPNCTIGENVTLAGPTTIGAGCRIERDSVIRRAALWSRCRIGAGAIIDDSIVVDDAVIEPETVIRETVWLERDRGSSDRRAKYWALPASEVTPRTNLDAVPAVDR